MLGRLAIITCAIVGLIVSVPTSSRAQVILPIWTKEKDQAEKVRIFGLGSVSLQGSEGASNIVADPAAQIGLEIQPRPAISVYTSFNKGAGLSETSIDDFSYSSLLYPESGNSAFQGSIRLMNEPLKRFLATCGHAIGYPRRDEKTSTWEVGPFAEFAWESYGLTQGETKRQIASRYLSLGLTHAYVYDTTGGENHLRLSTGLGWVNLHVPRGSREDYYALLNSRNALRTYNGFEVKMAVTVNQLTAEAEYINVGGNRKRDDVAAIKGEQVRVKLTAAGEFLSF